MPDVKLIALYNHHEIYFSKLVASDPGFFSVLKVKNFPIIYMVRSLGYKSLDDRTFLEILEERVQRKKQTSKKNKSALYWRFFAFSTRLELQAYECMFHNMLTNGGVSCLGGWNGGQRILRIAQLVCNHLNKPFFFFENGLLPGTTTLDPKGVNDKNSVPRSIDFYKNITFETSQELPKSLIPRRPSKDMGAEKALPDHYFFIPFQVDRDTQVRQNSPWIRDMRHLFEVVKEVQQQTGLTFVLKEHPSSRVVYDDLHVQVTENLFFANGNETQQLIENSMAVITINSTVGLEALLLKKKVILLGNACFEQDEISLSARSVDELASLCRGIESWTPSEVLVQNFMKYLYFDYCIPGLWKEASAEHCSCVKERIRRSLSMSC